MWGWHEIVGERNDPKPMGSVRLNTFYETRKKPLWLVALKLFGLLAIVAVGLLLLVPLVPLPAWQSYSLALGILMLYVGVAFFVRPEPTGDNMGLAGGLIDDPMHYSDDVNRALWNAHCFLGPGRFVAETILDACTLMGITAEHTAEQADEEAIEHALERDQRDRQKIADQVQQRLADRPAAKHGGTLELSTTQLLDPSRFGE